jgi:sulfur-carrier protein
VIHVNLFATFRLIAKIKSFDLELPPGESIFRAVRQIIRLHPALRPHWLDSSGGLHAHVHVLLNGEDVSLLPEGLNTPLQPGDTLDFFPPVAGG